MAIFSWGGTAHVYSLQMWNPGQTNVWIPPKSNLVSRCQWLRPTEEKRPMPLATLVSPSCLKSVPAGWNVLVSKETITQQSICTVQQHCKTWRRSWNWTVLCVDATTEGRTRVQVYQTGWEPLTCGRQLPLLSVSDQQAPCLGPKGCWAAGEEAYLPSASSSCSQCPKFLFKN